MTNGLPPVLPGCSVLPSMEPRPELTSNGKPTGAPKRTAATSNRFREFNSFVDCSMADLPRSEALAWLVLWRDTKPDGTVRTSMADISRRIGSSSRAVVTALEKLQKRGLVTLVFKGGLNRGASVYRVKPVAKPSR